MKITIDEDILSKYDISLDEFLVLLLFNLEVQKDDVLKRLNDKNLISYIKQFEGISYIKEEGKEIVKKIITESGEIEKNIKIDFLEIAKGMKELFPKGRKEGTNYMWRDSDAVIARRLQILTNKYNCKFTKEQAIGATKRYIESFNGNYTYMQLLKYFIFKCDIDNDGNTTFKSEMMSLIENEGQEDIDNNWVNTLV